MSFIESISIEHAIYLFHQRNSSFIILHLKRHERDKYSGDRPRCDKRESHISPAFGKRSAYAGNFAFPK